MKQALLLSVILAIVVALTLLAYASYTPGSASIAAGVLSKGIDGQTGQPTGVTDTFSSVDQHVYSSVVLSSPSTVSRNVTWLYLTPQGTRYSRSTVTVPPTGAPTSAQRTYATSIKIVGSVAGNMLGRWSVLVFVDGRLSLTQFFTLSDSTQISQPIRQIPWPYRQTYVHVEASPYYAKQAVVAATQQWNFSQAWFLQQYGYSSQAAYNLVLSNNTGAPISVSFNSSALFGHTSNAVSSFTFDSSGNVTGRCSVSIALALGNGTKFNGVFIENSALNQLGTCLGLGRVAYSGDLMNAFSENVYDLNRPSTLNLYSLYRLTNSSVTASTPPNVVLPSSIPYATSPSPPVTSSFPIFEFMIATAVVAFAVSADLLLRRRRARVQPVTS